MEATSNFVETTLWNGEVVVRFFPDEHQYFIQDNKCEDMASHIYVPSVTSITRLIGGDKTSGLMGWAVNEAMKYLDQNLDTGLVVPLIEEILDKLEGQMREDFSADSFYRAVESLEDVTVPISHWEHLKENAKKARNVARDASARLGNIVHKSAEWFVKARLGMDNTGISPVPEYADDSIKKLSAGVIRELQEWEKENEVIWEASEKIVYSRKYRYTGTADVFCLVKGKPVVVDFKTSKSLYHSFFVQGVAYSLAIEEETGVTSDVLMLRFSPKTGKILEKRNVLRDEGITNAFLGLRALYSWLKEA